MKYRSGYKFNVIPSPKDERDYKLKDIDVETSPKAHGMNITFVTTAADNASGRLLMDYMGMPFRKAAK